MMLLYLACEGISDTETTPGTVLASHTTALPMIGKTEAQLASLLPRL